MAGPTQDTPTRSYGGVDASDRIATRRDAFLRTGIELFGTRGFASVRVRDVCASAGLTTRYFYESFRGLPDLYRAVHDHVVDTLYEAVTHAVATASDDDPGTVMRAAVGGFVDTLADDPRRWRIVFTEPAAVDEQARDRSRAALRRFADLVATMARANLPEGIPDAHVRLLALSIVGTLDHAIAEWLGGDLDLDLDELVEACASQFEASFLDLAARA